MTKEVPVQAILPPEMLAKAEIIRKIRKLRDNIANLAPEPSQKDLLTISIAIGALTQDIEDTQFLKNLIPDLLFLKVTTLYANHLRDHPDAENVTVAGTIDMLKTAARLTFFEYTP